MKTIEITTAQKVTIQYELASVGNRIAAFFLDVLILLGILFVLSIFITTLKLSSLANQYFTLLVILPIYVFYTFFQEIMLDGQTFGKRIIGIKVVKLNGDPASAFDYLIRWAFRPVDIWLTGGSVAVLLVSSSRFSQRLGCLLSGTTVIRKNSSRSFSLRDILSINSTENYIPKYPSVVQLDEHDMIFLKKVLERNRKYRNPAHRQVISDLADKLADILDENPSNNKEKFLETLLTDYIVLTR